MIEKMDEELPIENFLPLAKSSVFELRKNDLFWPSFTALMSVYFNPKLNSDTMIQALDAIFEQSEFIQGLGMVSLKMSLILTFSVTSILGKKLTFFIIFFSTAFYFDLYLE